ncbi:hypothetical protein QWZ13_19335 [Reinekea marina]|uniref:hypothetical protein n=1 Tax=Reinekea marina TaxID=1310421 RepID=UPI0025B5943C|nr:hypothetical protein [Reinekea marina]MDN3647313.1 hypothetical protein [Reinekea marina]MDN3651069.1 hypothetical protein [Reinekea marina]
MAYAALFNAHPLSVSANPAFVNSSTSTSVFNSNVRTTESTTKITLRFFTNLYSQVRIGLKTNTCFNPK